MSTKLHYSSSYTDLASVATTGVTIRIGNIYRPLMKPYTRHKVEIPGRAGAWDFGGGVVRDYAVSVNFIITGPRSSDVQATAAAMTSALSTKQTIVFSDATSVAHTAQVYNAVQLTPDGAGNVARARIDFECDSAT